MSLFLLIYIDLAVSNKSLYVRFILLNIHSFLLIPSFSPTDNDVTAPFSSVNSTVLAKRRSYLESPFVKNVDIAPPGTINKSPYSAVTAFPPSS